VSTDNELSNLAGRSDRFIAAMIDAIIILIPVSITILLMVLVFGLDFDVENNNVSPVIYIVGAVVSFSVFFYINYKKLSENGQTIGKQFMGIQIVDLENNVIPIKTLILKRLLPYWLLPQIPFVGGILNLVNMLFIFGKPRRCIHDFIAGSKVVTVNKSRRMDAASCADV